MIDIIEDTILVKLKEKFIGFDVESFPVNFQKYNFLSPKGCILTRYEGSKMSEQITNISTMTSEKYNFTVFIALRYLSTHKKANPFLEELKTVLNGMPILTKRLKVNELNFEEEINGDLWFSYPVEIEFYLVDEYKDQSAAGAEVLSFGSKEHILGDVRCQSLRSKDQSIANKRIMDVIEGI